MLCECRRCLPPEDDDGGLLNWDSSRMLNSSSTTPQKPGKGAHIPRRYELAVVDFVRKLRLLKLKAGKSLLVGAANFLLRSTD